MRVQRDRKWCRELENTATASHDDDRTVRYSLLGTDDNGARVEELILGNWQVKFRDSSSALGLSIRTVHNCPWRTGILQSVCTLGTKVLGRRAQNRRFYIALGHFHRFKDEGSGFLEFVVTGCETQVQQVTSQTNMLKRSENPHWLPEPNIENGPFYWK